jgi:3-oxoacyl-[acyl-carrier-protein] synthase III
MTNRLPLDEQRLREIVELCVRRELPPDSAMPGPDVILCDDDGDGPLDSMAWVSVVRGIEVASGCHDFGDRMSDQTRSQSAMLAVLRSAAKSPVQVTSPSAKPQTTSAGSSAAIVGWASAVGARIVDASEVEKEFHLPAGKIKNSAGIKTISRLANGEDEISLCLKSCEAALAQARLGIDDVDCLIATSETFVGFPGLGAILHGRLLIDESCKVIDVGGACVGLLNSLFIAKCLLESGQARLVLVASGDTHSRILLPGRVKGEFGGLFGDGASAFVLQLASPDGSGAPYRLDEFLFGCAGTYAAALRIGLSAEQGIALTFDGEILARAAVEQMGQVLEDLELRTGRKRSEASAFALHQPNPRLLQLLARQAGLPLNKIPQVAVSCGNLGSSTCGVALSMALTEKLLQAGLLRGPIFVAAVGPGLLWGGTVLY